VALVSLAAQACSIISPATLDYPNLRVSDFADLRAMFKPRCVEWRVHWKSRTTGIGTIALSGLSASGRGWLRVTLGAPWRTLGSTRISQQIIPPAIPYLRGQNVLDIPGSKMSNLITTERASILRPIRTMMGPSLADQPANMLIQSLRIGGASRSVSVFLWKCLVFFSELTRKLLHVRLRLHVVV
jgi:hypothetical protein